MTITTITVAIYLSCSGKGRIFISQPEVAAKAKDGVPAAQ